jgi:hypothetical protein
LHGSFEMGASFGRATDPKQHAAEVGLGPRFGWGEDDGPGEPFQGGVILAKAKTNPKPEGRAKDLVKVAGMHVHAATMRRLAIVVQPPTAPSPHAAKTAAILAHLPAITAPKRVVMATIRAL